MGAASTPDRIDKIALTQTFTLQVFVSSHGTIAATYYYMRSANESEPGRANIGFRVARPAERPDWVMSRRVRSMRHV